MKNFSTEYSYSSLNGFILLKTTQHCWRKSIFTNKGGSRRPEKSRRNWIHFHEQGYGQGQCKGKLVVHGQRQCKGEVEEHGQEQCRGKVEGHGKQQHKGKFERHGQG